MSGTIDELFDDAAFTDPPRHAHRAQRPHVRRPRKPAGRIQRLLIVVIAALGLGVLLYPAAAAWFTDRAHESKITGYVHDIQTFPQNAKSAELDAAVAYNQRLPRGPIGDPYAGGRELDPGNADVADYLRQLDKPDEIMGRIRIPSVKIDLPVFHGTSEQTLAEGVGHLYGSSLPVGGPGTHAVLSGHSGFVNATLFDHLRDVRLGDVFTISVLDQTLYYQVDDIRVVLPTDTSSLRTERGKDYITLVTCTPIGVNSHRLLVRGTRIPAPPTNAQTDVRVPGTGQTAGFPLWAAEFTAGLALVLMVVYARRPRRRITAKPPTNGTPNA